MEIVAGLSLRNLEPRVWDSKSPHYLPDVKSVMVSYADFDSSSRRRFQAMEQGLRQYLDVADSCQIFLDNGSFAFTRQGRRVSAEHYLEFVAAARPDWHVIPQDFIPTPSVSPSTQRQRRRQTMEMNRRYSGLGCVPVVHVGSQLDSYIRSFKADDCLRMPKNMAIGGIVPNLLRAPKALPHTEIVTSLWRILDELSPTHTHLFGVGGTATVHLAALLGIDSVDSAGWRNRAARGIVQLPGRGDRLVANLGSWRGRTLSPNETELLAECACPACTTYGIEGLRASKIHGFCNRATHNLWVLLEEAKAVNLHLKAGTFEDGTPAMLPTQFTDR